MKQITLILAAMILCSSCEKLTLQQQADQIHARILTLDTHNDTPMSFMRGQYDIALDNPNNCVDIPKMEIGGLDGAFFAVFVNQGLRDSITNEKVKTRALDVFDRIGQVVAANSDKLAFCTTPEQALAAKKAGKRILFTGIENGYAIGNDLNLIDQYADLGARYITLVHSRNNDICDSANDTLEHGGLSTFGRQVIQRMNQKGVMVDISHASDLAAMQAIECSIKPVIASHSCAKSICDNPRNLNDTLLRALAAKGGVMQLCILSDYVSPAIPNPKQDSAVQVIRDKYQLLGTLDEDQKKLYSKEIRAARGEYPNQLATIAQAIDHIDYVVNLVGIDHVGIGTDFDGGGGLADCPSAAYLKGITVELLRRGYTQQDIEKIWSGNIMRVLREVETVS